MCGVSSNFARTFLKSTSATFTARAPRSKVADPAVDRTGPIVACLSLNQVRTLDTAKRNLKADNPGSGLRASTAGGRTVAPGTPLGYHTVYWASMSLAELSAAQEWAFFPTCLGRDHNETRSALITRSTGFVASTPKQTKLRPYNPLGRHLCCKHARSSAPGSFCRHTRSLQSHYGDVAACRTRRSGCMYSMCPSQTQHSPLGMLASCRFEI